MMPLYGVSFGQDLFVAVGDGGTILTSKDGTHWGPPKMVATFKNLRGITYGGGLFVAVGDDGVILTSPNGFQWTSQVSNVTGLLWGVTYGNGRFVAVGSMGGLVTSPNGLDWTKQNSGVPQFLYSVAYGNGKFVAVGNSGRIISSSDGVDWVPQQVTTYELRGIIYGNNAFTVAGLGGAILTSDTGISWNPTSIGVQYFLYSITYGNGTFVAVGEDATTHGGIVSHSNGAAWATANISEYPLNGAGYGNSIFMAAGERGSILRNLQVDYHGWTSISEGTTSYLNAVLPFKNQLVAAGYQVIMGSPNGVTWQPKSKPPVNLWSVASNGTTCVVVGDWGTILSSSDLEQWLPSTIGTLDFLLAVTYGGNGKFVALGLSDKVYTSPDGKTWKDHPLGGTYWINGISYGNNTFAAVGLGGGVLTSPDGENWNFTPSGVSQTLNSIAFGKGLFVAVGDAGVILTSVDGTHWEPAPNFPTSNTLFSVAFAQDSFFAVGAQGTIIFSEDGNHWSSHHSWITKELHGAAWTGSYGIAVGADRTFLQSSANAKLYLPLLLGN
jgi:hypothetical protein